MISAPSKVAIPLLPGRKALLLCAFAISIALLGLWLSRTDSREASADAAEDGAVDRSASKIGGLLPADIDPHYVDASRLPPLPAPARATAPALDPGDLRLLPIGEQAKRGVVGNRERPPRPVEPFEANDRARAAR